MIGLLLQVPETLASTVPAISGIRVEFILFGLTLLGVALFHHYTMQVALTGLATILVFKLVFDDSFHAVEHLVGSPEHEGEWRVLLNLLGLLLGFAVLAKHFEESRLPEILPKFLPDDWKGAFTLLVMVFFLSSFLDNIAAAMIGGTIAMVVFKGKVHIGYIAGVIAASNAGGSGSVVGDTTTTMMWIDGVAAMDVTHAYVAAFPALLIFGLIASFMQDKYQRIVKDAPVGVEIEWKRIVVVAMILAGTIATNVLLDFPAVGVWLGILVGASFTKTPWHEVSTSLKGSIFLLSLVMCASMMPVEELPPASWVTALTLGFVSAVFDNIPLTKLALDQGGYDWGMLAYAVGFGGSMVWFGSSAGVAMSNLFPQAKNTMSYLRYSWPVVIAYVAGFFVLLGTLGWQPHEPHNEDESQVSTVIEATR